MEVRLMLVLLTMIAYLTGSAIFLEALFQEKSI
jgi:hypothetical protein